MHATIATPWNTPMERVDKDMGEVIANKHQTVSNIMADVDIVNVKLRKLVGDVRIKHVSKQLCRTSEKELENIYF